MNKRVFFPTIRRVVLGILSLFVLWAGCSRNDTAGNSKALAVVDDRVISEDDFIQRFQKIKTRLGLIPNGEVRRKVLRNFINEELLINEARELHLDDTPAAQFEYQRIKIQELLNAYYRQVVYQKTTVSEAELKQLYINLNTTLTARHLYAPTKQKADSLYQLLQQGIPFEKLARENFTDPVLRENGGLIGSFTVDEMDPAFEDAAYRLQVGETSRPVRTQDGYSIIRLEARKVKPFLLETDYANHKAKLYRYWKNRKTKERVRALVDSIAEALDIRFNKQTITVLYQDLQDANNINRPEDVRRDWPINGLSEKTPLLSSQLGEWDIRAFRQAARFTSAKQRRHIRSPQALKSFISGLVVRQKLLAEARAMGLDKTEDYTKRVEFEFDSFLLQQMEKQIYASIEVPQDTLRAYYEKNKERFKEAAQINIREIVLDKEEKAALVSRKLKQGVPFAALARQYSIRKWSAERGGEVGYLNPNDLGRWSQTVFALEKDQWIGPLKTGKEIVFVQCINKKPARQFSFTEVARDVEEAVKAEWWERERSEKIKEIESRVPVMAYWEKLNDIRLN